MHQNRADNTSRRPPSAAPAPPALPAVPGVFLLALLAYTLTTQWQTLQALSTFGVANALMLGLLVRIPSWRTMRSYASIGLASLLAGWLEGRSFSDALLWGTADAAGVATGVLLLARLPVPTVQLRRENSPLFVLLACLLASAVTTLLRLPVQMPLLGSAWPKELALALSTEFMNHVLILPVVLTFHSYSHWHRLELRHTLPLVALLLSELLATLIGGPGAIAFTLPAFIWCALRYPLSATASIFALFTLWKCQAFAMGHSSMTSAYFSDMVSLRVGLSLLWLGPLTVACSQKARNEVLQRLNYASQHDYLTRTLVRATFVQRSDATLAQMRSSGAPLAMLMLDIDHFKQVNDQHGHAMGDVVLQGFAATVARQLRQSDLVGRYGGEEFCVCLPAISPPDALRVAERLRAAVLALPFTTPNGTPLHVTVSLGLAHFAGHALPPSTDAALAQADALLYRAKTGGRNRVEHACITQELSPALVDAVTPAPPAALTAPQPVKG